MYFLYSSVDSFFAVLYISFFFFFFFQAEDGIRDVAVTGVQTCALPISFDLNAPMGDSTCISCGECMVSCPTGALTNKGLAGTAIAGGPGAEIFEAEELLQIPVFKGVSGTFLELNRGAIVNRHFRKGEVICREGEFGSTAFSIVEGRAKVSISTPIAHVKTQGGAKGFFNRLTSTLVGREED